MALLNKMVFMFATHETTINKKIVISEHAEDTQIFTDRTLLSRVIGNLIKNALEAEKNGAVITISCRKTENGAVFLVHNQGSMLEDTRLQVFQRSFSTKGEGRGLGTYSVKLMTEKYLQGKISFTTNTEGTEFRAEYPASITS